MIGTIQKEKAAEKADVTRKDNALIEVEPYFEVIVVFASIRKGQTDCNGSSHDKTESKTEHGTASSKMHLRGEKSSIDRSSLFTKPKIRPAHAQIQIEESKNRT
jgi:hypothetical protein